LSIAEISNSSELRLTEKGEKGFSFMQKSAGVMGHWKISNSKHQITGFQVSGVRSIGKYQIQSTKSQGFRFQVSGKRNIEAETSVFVICDL
jgi:hypothetical protein